MTHIRLRLRLFVALSGAAFAGALTTGLYAVLVDPTAIGFLARLGSVAPKAIALGCGLLPLLVLGARALGNALARPFEDVAHAALRAAQGDRLPAASRAGGVEAHRIARALGSLRREIDRGPYSAAVLRDAWHDLRGSLAAVRASLELLEDRGLPPADRQRFTANAARSAGQLDRELEELVTLARLETASLAPQGLVSMRAVVRAAVDRARPLAEAGRVRLLADAAIAGPSQDEVLGDASALGRAVSNLIQNACAATPGGTIRVVCDDQAAGSVVVDVTNEPAHVPRDARAHLFGRVNPAPGSGSGGLGLAIARAAVEAHGGHVRFVEWGPPRVRVRIELPR